MLTITWVYTRPNTDHPMYPDTEEGAAAQAWIDDLRANSGLVKGYMKTRAPDELTETAVYMYENIDKLNEFSSRISAQFPNHFSNRLAYILEKDHSLVGTGSEPCFFRADLGEMISQRIHARK